MATKTVFYGSPNDTVRREWSGNVEASASGTYCQYTQLQKFRLKSVNGVVLVAGTATDAALTIRQGTTSLAAITLGTQAALSTFTSGTLDTEFSSLQLLNVLKSNDGTLQAVVSYEIEVLPDAVMTA